MSKQPKKIPIDVQAEPPAPRTPAGGVPLEDFVESEPDIAKKDVEPEPTPPVGERPTEESLDFWRDRAMRLQAEMENFRKRQQRLSLDHVSLDRARVLRKFLVVADNLERALEASGESGGLVEGVRLTYRALMDVLRSEGVEPLHAEGKLFDPELHEAVASVPAEETEVESGTIVEVTQKGYRLGDHLLRPAQVIVAS